MSIEVNSMFTLQLSINYDYILLEPLQKIFTIRFYLCSRNDKNTENILNPDCHHH